ncbi:MAG: hypothetical protein MR842_04420 [Clostridiales bacterium]|nr:hypothetical protein [Clostridiales bacterium]MDO4351482.1 tocopherol cyclase family protein [Eubacteriales bacterium]MDY4009340.1 tocopherol cyclase family protein [Candidatus Limiplasma sp.]
MKTHEHVQARSGPYFEGWYLKLQTKAGKALALIPALHVDSAGRRGASLQVVSSNASWWLEYPAADFSASREPFRIHLGPNRFAAQGISLRVQRPGCSLYGALRFGPFLPLQSDIMGPFRFLSGMECRHGVISMAHPLEGALTLNGETLEFSGGTGYIETDRGASFPSGYLWTQCAWHEGRPASLMLSVATIPLSKLRFTGCICAVLYRGQEYRLATYRGVRVEEWSRHGAVIRQGKYRLEAEAPGEGGQALRAPVAGAMRRTIHENLATEMRYRFWIGEKLLFEHTDRCASFEYV